MAQQWAHELVYSLFIFDKLLSIVVFLSDFCKAKAKAKVKVEAKAKAKVN